VKNGDGNGRSACNNSIVEMPVASVATIRRGTSKGSVKALLKSAMVCSSRSNCNSDAKAIFLKFSTTEIVTEKMKNKIKNMQ
jgi:hypothetical protein